MSLDSDSPEPEKPKRTPTFEEMFETPDWGRKPKKAVTSVGGNAVASTQQPARVQDNSYSELMRPQAKFTEQQVNDVIAPQDEYEIWCADVIQMLWVAHGLKTLEVADINNALGKQLDLARVYKILSSPSFYARMQARGVDWLPDWNPQKHNALRDRERLTPQQTWALQIMTDPTDSRSTASKLKHIGITYQTWRNWLREPYFNELVKTTAEQLLGDSLANVHTRLVSKAEAGDVTAMKLYYEVSGRHDPNRQQMLDFTKVLGLILEALQRHIPDPQILARVALDIDKIVAGKPLSEIANLPANLDIVDADVIEGGVVPDGFFDNKEE
jgi:hypothetical protein